MGSAVLSGRLPRHQSGNGLAVCGFFGDATTECSRSLAVTAADCGRARCGNRSRSCRRGAAGSRGSSKLRQDICCLRSLWVRSLPAVEQKTSSLGRYASRVQGFDDLVIPDGISSRRRLHAVACSNGRAGRKRPSRDACRSAGDIWALGRRLGSGCAHAGISAGDWSSCLCGLQMGWVESLAQNLGKPGSYLGCGAHCDGDCWSGVVTRLYFIRKAHFS